MATKKKPRLSANEWSEARMLYVQGFVDDNGERQYMTLEALARRFKVNITTVHRHSKEEGWRDQRIVFEQKLSQEIDEQKRKQLSDEAVEFDANSLKLAKALQADIVRLMRLAQTERQRYEAMLQSWHDRRERAVASGRDFSEPFPPQPTMITSGGVNQLASALEKTHKTGRLALGESTENRNVHGTISATDEGLAEAFDIIERLAGSGQSRHPIIH